MPFGIDIPTAKDLTAAGVALEDHLIVQLSSLLPQAKAILESLLAGHQIVIKIEKRPDAADGATGPIAPMGSVSLQGAMGEAIGSAGNTGLP